MVRKISRISGREPFCNLKYNARLYAVSPAKTTFRELKYVEFQNFLH